MTEVVYEPKVRSEWYEVEFYNTRWGGWDNAEGWALPWPNGKVLTRYDELEVAKYDADLLASTNGSKIRVVRKKKKKEEDSYDY